MSNLTMMIALATLTACDNRPRLLNGIPPDVSVACRQGGGLFGGILTCIGGGKIYTCIRQPGAETPNYRSTWECAQTSPSKPKAEAGNE